MVRVTVHGTVEPRCCWLRQAPPNLDINLYCTYNQILQAVSLQQWFPLNCHYCNYKPKQVDDYGRHVVRKHAGKPAYPGPTHENKASIFYIVESIKRELKEMKTQQKMSQVWLNRGNEQRRGGSYCGSLKNRYFNSLQMHSNLCQAYLDALHHTNTKFY